MLYRNLGLKLLVFPRNYNSYFYYFKIYVINQRSSFRHYNVSLTIFKKMMQILEIYGIIMSDSDGGAEKERRVLKRECSPLLRT